jgi:hypothetical protein
MKIRSRILLALDVYGGSISGKTLLQKRLFFTAQCLQEDWGYNPHFYGPYSSLVASELVTLKVQGLVNESCLQYGVENTSGFEMKRCDYTLTDPGRQAVGWLKMEFPADSDQLQAAALRVLRAGDLGYEDLSVAAKSYFILTRSGRSRLSTAEITEKAREFSWKVSEPQISKACGYLVALGLVKTPDAAK